jgi:flagellar biosynthetic protein FliR
MRTDADLILIPFGMIFNFGLLLMRTAGLMAFIPIPGLRSAFEVHRLTLAMLFAFLLLPWTSPPASAALTVGDIAWAACSEASLGLCLGLAVALVQEGIQLGAQMIGLQAGFSYASTIDPSSNADSAILQVLLNLGSAMLFLALGLDTVLMRLLLHGVQALQPGQWVFSPALAEPLIRLFQSIFVEAIRVSLPVVAILLVIDATLALLSRIQPQLQLLSLSFPLKMLMSIVVLAAGTPYLPSAVERAAMRSLEAIQTIQAGSKPATERK